MMAILVDVSKEVLKNAAMSVPFIRDRRLKKPRTSGVFADTDEALNRYALMPLRSLLENLGSVKGCNILEIGPGDHLASGLSMLAAGAKTYTALDRFPGDYQSRHAKDWYRGLKAAWERFFPDMPWSPSLTVEDFPEAHADKVTVIPRSIEDVEVKRGYDIVCSFHVVEHVSDIKAFADVHQKLLAPNGKAVHLVDFGPHNWGHYSDQLTFLHFPEWLWQLMGSSRGTPNRHRYHEIKKVLEDAGLKVEAVSVEIIPDNINRRKLSRDFRDMPTESLSVLTATFVCRKQT